MKWDWASRLLRRPSSPDGTAKRVESTVRVTATLRVWRDKEQRWEDGPVVTSEA